MKPKKSLGQNFLRDKNILDKIIQAADLKADDFVIEVGPGEGILTEELVKKAGKVVAIEIDDNLASKLDSRLRGNDKVEIVNDDILKINLPEIIETRFFCHSERSVAKSMNLLNTTTSNIRKQIPRLRDDAKGVIAPLGMTSAYKVIANIPYYITSPIIQLFLETKYPPTEMILMVQREVAERICASPGQMSILAVSVQYYAEPKLLFYVDKKSFYPVPEVDSAVIKITPYAQLKPSPVSSTRHPLPITGEEDNETKNFFRIVKAGFSAKRKTLLNNLSNSLHLDRKIAEEAIGKAGLKPSQRAQELSVEDWKKLAKTLSGLTRLTKNYGTEVFIKQQKLRVNQQKNMLARKTLF
jgi:16S rRNA (adenine1518-N6/adenine1519-N6)-dimethyltransferase